MPTNRFEKYKKTTLFSVILLGLILSALLLNGVASALGLGKVILYESSALIGYRPLPNQVMTRTNATITINNLGLRSKHNWDDQEITDNNIKSSRILFLGDSVTYGGSYIDDEGTFANLVAKNLSKPNKIMQAGNAGVNAYGVLNMVALIMDKEFTPASVYVTTLPECDFYRGFNRISGMPFWGRKPKFALEELFGYFAYRLNSTKYLPLEHSPSADTPKVRQIAVNRLKEMDTYLLKQGHTHQVFISPTKKQVLGLEPIDTELKVALQHGGLSVVYLLDEIKTALNEQKITIDELFHDDIHLNQKGHALYAELISRKLTAHQ